VSALEIGDAKRNGRCHKHYAESSKYAVTKQLVEQIDGNSSLNRSGEENPELTRIEKLGQLISMTSEIFRAGINVDLLIGNIKLTWYLNY